jgi:hypothetical protein
MARMAMMRGRSVKQKLQRPQRIAYDVTCPQPHNQTKSADLSANFDLGFVSNLINNVPVCVRGA